jgi:hypothetical protein
MAITSYLQSIDKFCRKEQNFKKTKEKIQYLEDEINRKIQNEVRNKKLFCGLLLVFYYTTMLYLM